MLSKCLVCNGSKKVRQMGFVFAECKACKGEGKVKLDKAIEQKEEADQAKATKPEVKASAKKGKATS